MSALSDAMMRGLQRLPWRAVPLLFAVAGLVGVTSPLWRGCTSISERGLLVLLGAFALGCALMFQLLLVSWERSDASLGVRLRGSALLLLGVGALALITIPNLIGAVDGRRQKLTMADMRTLATAFELEAQAKGRLPILEGSAEEAVRVLPPAANGKPLPTKDAWGTPFLVRSDGQHYAIVSLGLCGEREVGDPFTLPEEETHRLSADMIFRDGSLVRYPSGVQEE